MSFILCRHLPGSAINVQHVWWSGKTRTLQTWFVTSAETFIQIASQKPHRLVTCSTDNSRYCRTTTPSLSVKIAQQCCC